MDYQHPEGLSQLSVVTSLFAEQKSTSNKCYLAAMKSHKFLSNNQQGIPIADEYDADVEDEFESGTANTSIYAMEDQVNAPQVEELGVNFRLFDDDWYDSDLAVDFGSEFSLSLDEKFGINSEGEEHYSPVEDIDLVSEVEIQSGIEFQEDVVDSDECSEWVAEKYTVFEVHPDAETKSEEGFVSTISICTSEQSLDNESQFRTPWSCSPYSCFPSKEPLQRQLLMLKINTNFTEDTYKPYNFRVSNFEFIFERTIDANCYKKTLRLIAGGENIPFQVENYLTNCFEENEVFKSVISLGFTNFAKKDTHDMLYAMVGVENFLNSVPKTNDVQIEVVILEQNLRFTKYSPTIEELKVIRGCLFDRYFARIG